MLIPSLSRTLAAMATSLSRRVNANSQLEPEVEPSVRKLIKKGEC